MEITRRDALKMASSAAIVGGPSAATAHDATCQSRPAGCRSGVRPRIPTPDTVEKLYDTMDFPTRSAGLSLGGSDRRNGRCAPDACRQRRSEEAAISFLLPGIGTSASCSGRM